MVKPKLLVVELWGLGDLVIASPFLRAASEAYDVTLLAKPYALDLRPRFWPAVQVDPFVAPWTAFVGKYRFWRWPWAKLWRLRHLRSERYDIGLSARWDPRDHFLLWAFRARRRIGYPRMRSQVFLTDALSRPHPEAHRYESWRTLAEALGLGMPARDELPQTAQVHRPGILVHSGAGQPVRVWPLDRYQALVRRLRMEGHQVHVACDPDQRAWWLAAGEADVRAPVTVTDLLTLIDRAGMFMGNDSGPSHLAAACGLATFTLFGPQLPEWFAPLSRRAEWLEGKACPYKPCSDYCRFPHPLCLHNVSLEEVKTAMDAFIARATPKTAVR
jgi:ADP-heptose:LPS heptosyltransferase